MFLLESIMSKGLEMIKYGKIYPMINYEKSFVWHNLASNLENEK